MAAAAVVVMAAGCASVDEPAEGGLYGNELMNPYAAPDRPLTDTDGRPFRLTGDTGKPVTLVFFGYTHCPDTCPLVMSNITQALTRLSDDDRADVDVVFITTDPARDDGATLRRYLDQFDPTFIGLTGRMSDLVKVGNAFHVYMKGGRRLPSGGYDVEHTDYVFAIDADDEIPAIWSAETTGAQFAADLNILLH